MSIIPFMFCFVGFTVLALYYPRNARGEQAYAKLLEASAAMKRGETVEDPWCSGNWIAPLVRPKAAVPGALAYLWPSDLEEIIERSDGGAPNFKPAERRLRWRCCLSVAVCIPGAIVFAGGFSKLLVGDDTSISPFGVMILGVGVTSLAFHWKQWRAVKSLAMSGVSLVHMDAVQYRFDLVAPFVQRTREPQQSDSTLGAPTPSAACGESQTTDVPAEGTHGSRSDACEVSLLPAESAHGSRSDACEVSEVPESPMERFEARI